MSSMCSRERVLAALHLEVPDRVPWVEKYVHRELASKLLNKNIEMPPGARIAPEVLAELPLDAITCNLRPPTLSRKQWTISDVSIGEGLLKTWDDLEQLQELLSRQHREELLAQIGRFVSIYKRDYAAVLDTRIGIASTYISMGIERFSLMLYDDPAFVEAAIDLFSEWTGAAVEQAEDLGFDIIVASDDLAGKQGPLFAPAVIRNLFLPHYRKVMARTSLPWIIHSDGNIAPVLDDILSLGVKGIANIEPGPMDIDKLKKDVGERVCLMGNIDLHYTLTRGTPEETRVEVRERIQNVGPGGGYILASANGLTAYCKPENVRAMARALTDYGHYPLAGG